MSFLGEAIGVLTKLYGERFLASTVSGQESFNHFVEALGVAEREYQQLLPVPKPSAQEDQSWT